MSGFEKDLNYGTSTIRRYSINVNNATLENLLTNLADNTQIPTDERDIKRAVSVIGRNTNGRGQRRKPGDMRRLRPGMDQSSN